MKRSVFLALAVCLVTLAFPVCTWAQSARHVAMANTGIAAFNPGGYAPILENVATATTAPNYSVLWESHLAMLLSKTDAYEYSETDGGDSSSGGEEWSKSKLNVLGSAALSAATFLVPLTQKGQNEMGGRVALFGYLGYLSEIEYSEQDFEDVDRKTTVLHQAGGPALRFGVAYGFTDMVSLGGAVNYQHLGRQSEFEDDNNDADQKTKMEPELEGFKIEDYEIGLLFQPVAEFQIGTRFNFGDHAYVEGDSVTVKVNGDNVGEAAYSAVYSVPAGFGLGFAYFDEAEWSLAFDLQRTMHDQYKFMEYPEKTEISLGFEKGFSQKYKIRAGIGKIDEADAVDYSPSHLTRFDIGGGFRFANVVVLDLALGLIMGDSEPQDDLETTRTAGFETALTIGGNF